MAVTSWRSPGTVTEDTSVGTDVITNEANVANTGSPYATLSWTSGTKTSSRIKATNWGFTTSDVPSGSTIDGIEFRYDRVENSTTDNLETKEIYHIDSSGTLQTGTNSADTGEWPTTRATATVGGSTNKMGYTGVTAADVIDSDFGISFRCGTVGSGTTPAGDFGVFQMRIHYTAGTTYNDTITESVASSESSTVTASMAAPHSESVASSESSTAAMSTTGSVSESVAASDSIAGAMTSPQSVSESVASSESATITAAMAASRSESAAATDSNAAAASSSVTISESGAATDSIAGTLSTSQAVSESCGATESCTGTAAHGTNVTESVASSDAQSVTLSGAATRTETVTASDSYEDNSAPPETATFDWRQLRMHGRR